MNTSQKWRWGITAALFVLGCFMFWPTFQFWTMSDTARAAMQQNDPGGYLKLQTNSIRLGLDLQGGIHTVLRVKTEEIDAAAREGAVDRAIQVLRTRIDGLGVAEPIIQKQGDDRVIVDLPGYTDPARAEELIGQTAQLQFKLLESIESANLILGRIDSAIALIEGNSPTSTSSTPSTPSTDTTKKSDDILSEMMGTDSANDTMKTADAEEFTPTESSTPFTSKLEPNMYNNRTGIQWPGYIVGKRDYDLMNRWLQLPEVRRVIPPDVQLAWSTRSAIRSNRETYEFYVLKKRVYFQGDKLEGIRLAMDAEGYRVNFALSSDAADRFQQLTGANIDKPLAIVIDDKVESAPMIQSKIRNSGQITMGSGASVEEARNLEIVLQAGALPAPVEIIEKNVVGASLGADSIRKGFLSSVVGLLLVLAYIGVYYKVSGMIANLGLLFNVFFLLAVLAAVGATLTMPGIAGIILTIGISVDSNILIFERIREEMNSGKSVRAAIDAGYDRAFSAILDSHVTTLITAAALFIFGSGAVRGFAITLFWGVSLSLFTAYVITKAVFDMRKTYKTLSI